MKTQVIDMDGKKIREIELPSFFSEKLREDLIFKAIETQKHKQPYSPSLMAGLQHSASKIVRHRRHVWKTAYGLGISRIPRKVMSRRGNRFNWVGAEVAGAVGGRRAHPPKVVSMINTKKLNKKENKIAFLSALSATANQEIIRKRYKTLQTKKISAPIIVNSFPKKTKEIIKGLKNILGDSFEVALKKKSIRSGKGKMRGRKYKSNAGLLVVIGKTESLKTTGIEIKKASNLNVIDLAKGGPGRLTIYTENAIKDLEERLNSKVKENKK